MKCPCRRTKCKRHGNCEACRNHHHSYEKIPLTTCERNELRKAQKKDLKKNTDEEYLP